MPKHTTVDNLGLKNYEQEQMRELQIRLAVIEKDLNNLKKVVPTDHKQYYRIERAECEVNDLKDLFALK